MRNGTHKVLCLSRFPTFSASRSQYHSGSVEEVLVDAEVPSFAMIISTGGDAVQPGHRELLTVSYGSTKAETRTEHKVLSTLLIVENEPANLKPFTVQKFYSPKKKTSSAESVSS